MDLAAAEKFLLSLQPGKIDLDLARLQRVLAGLSLLPPPFPCVLVGGTNGKGSTIVFAEALLRPHRRIGAFVKPHVFRITERVRLDGKPASDAAFAAATAQLQEFLAQSGESVTFFEATLIVALLAMKTAGVELALIEVGLGGRFDAANALPRVLTAITSIDYDHEKYLGPYLSGIAVEKAGIMAEDVPVILSRGLRTENPDCRGILLKLAALKHAPVVEQSVLLERISGSAFPPRPEFALEAELEGIELPPRLFINQLGLYQRHNFVTALRLSAELKKRGYLPRRFYIPSSLTINYPGRFEVHRVGQGHIVLDAAHNPEGMRALAETLREYFLDVRPTLAFGCQEGKDIVRLLTPLKGLISQVVAIELPILHPMPLADVKAGVQQAGFRLRLPDAPFADQMSALLEEVEGGSCVLVAGSIYYLGTVAEALGIGVAPQPELNQ